MNGLTDIVKPNYRKYSCQITEKTNAKFPNCIILITFANVIT